MGPSDAVICLHVFISRLEGFSPNHHRMFEYQVRGDLKTMVDVKSISRSDTYQETKITSQEAVLIERVVFKVVHKKEQTVATSFVSIFGAKHSWLCCGARSSPRDRLSIKPCGWRRVVSSLRFEGWIFLQVALLSRLHVESLLGCSHQRQTADFGDG